MPRGPQRVFERQRENIGGGKKDGNKRDIRTQRASSATFRSLEGLELNPNTDLAAGRLLSPALLGGR